MQYKEIVIFYNTKQMEKKIEFKEFEFLFTSCLTYYIYSIIILALLITLQKFCFPYLKGQYLQPVCFLAGHNKFYAQCLRTRKASARYNSLFLRLIDWVIFYFMIVLPLSIHIFGQAVSLHYKHELNNITCSNVFTGTLQGFSRTDHRERLCPYCTVAFHPEYVKYLKIFFVYARNRGYQI